MDTRPLENQAEDLIKHKLLKFDFLVTKPTFDKEGADLLIIKDISQKVTPFIKIQCKGRTIDKNSNVVIPKRYVEDNFIIFLYVEIKETKEDFLYVFFKEDIEKWNALGDNFQLSIPKSFNEKEDFQEKLFNKNIAIRIENLLLKQAINHLIKSYDSILIDGIFLEKAVMRTKVFIKNCIQIKNLRNPILMT